MQGHPFDCFNSSSMNFDLAISFPTFYFSSKKSSSVWKYVERESFALEINWILYCIRVFFYFNKLRMSNFITDLIWHTHTHISITTPFHCFIRIFPFFEVYIGVQNLKTEFNSLFFHSNLLHYRIWIFFSNPIRKKMADVVLYLYFCDGRVL